MNKFVEKVSSIMDVGARAAVTGIMLAVTLNVIMRAFGSSLKGTVEIVQYLNAVAVGLGLALCAFHGGHVAVTFLTDRFPLRIQKIVGVIIEVLVAGFLAVTAWQLVLYGNGMKEQGEIALTLGIPIHPIVYLVTVGVAGYLLVVLNNVVLAIKSLFSSPPDNGEKPDDKINVEDLISQ